MTIFYFFKAKNNQTQLNSSSTLTPCIPSLNNSSLILDNSISLSKTTATTNLEQNYILESEMNNSENHTNNKVNL